MGGSSLYIEAMAVRPPADASVTADVGETGGATGEGANDAAGGGAGSGGGRLRTTGQLGDVMNESAQV